jgi:hypothetical protein
MLYDLWHIPGFLQRAFPGHGTISQGRQFIGTINNPAPAGEKTRFDSGKDADRYGPFKCRKHGMFQLTAPGRLAIKLSLSIRFPAADSAVSDTIRPGLTSTHSDTREKYNGRKTRQGLNSLV